MKVSVNSNLQSAYSNQYLNETAQWRGLGAIQKAQNIKDITQGYTFNKVLEVGAGDGSVLLELSKVSFAKEFSALEISESGVDKIKEKQIPNLVSVMLFDGYSLPFADKSFDLVILTHVLEHVEHERLLLKELHRVAKYLVIEVPKDYRFGADKKVKHFLSYGHINLYTPTSLKFLLKTENFIIHRELTRLYNKGTFLFGKTSFIHRLKAYLVYYFKYVFINTPFPYINHKFINTITLLVEAENTSISIF
ncbi:class I SAM-dependent methyltransferase [Flectobacillus major]|uniref:class I SAM-dependent methyltransferase n=1 Tax=Flectobacillus major TaxID=103 RepID=UPI0004017518|nr:class I SAM-dependent methyltransferase [Flectobacillus major]